MQTLVPTAVRLGNLSGSAADLDESPDSPDGNWCQRIGAWAIAPASGALRVVGQAPSIPLYALEFPSNGDSPSDAFVALQFLNPHSNGLPIWGPGNAGTTWIWRYKPVQQDGYYVTFWWSNNGVFLWDGGNPNTYYGAHPYPQPPAGSSTDHVWEIATSYGGDAILTRTDATKAVVKGQWYTQALRVTKHGDSTKTLLFYTSLPSTADGDIVDTTHNPSLSLDAGYGETNPPSPAVTFGDSPWYGSYGHERMSGSLGQVKIFASVLSESDMLAEAAAMNQLVTSAGQSAIWWGKRGFANVDDLVCDYGTGRSFGWADTDNKATLGDAL